MINHTSAGLTDAQALEIFRWILLARRLDERLALLQRSGAIPLAVSCRGHEAAQVGAALAFEPGRDWWFNYYRDLAAILVAGSTPAGLMLSSFGRAADPASGGRQTPYNWGDRRHKIVARSAPVGVQIPQAAGVALGARHRGENLAVYCSFGEGAASQGDFHEGLNYAAVHRLPVIYLCQNNGWAISVPAERQTAGGGVAQRAAGYGIPGETLDGTDPFAVYQATRSAVERALAGEGPTLLELKVHRLEAHTCDDNQRLYRAEAELSELPKQDPLPALRAYLQTHSLLSAEAEQELETAIRAEIDAAEEAARAAPVAEPDW